MFEHVMKINAASRLDQKSCFFIDRSKLEFNSLVMKYMMIPI